MPCFRWPALNCDGNWNASRDPANSNFYNGSNPLLKPGALLAVPQVAARNVDCVSAPSYSGSCLDMRNALYWVGKFSAPSKHNANSGWCQDITSANGLWRVRRHNELAPVCCILESNGVELSNMSTNRYLDDNTAWNAGAFNVEGGVIEEVADA